MLIHATACVCGLGGDIEYCSAFAYGEDAVVEGKGLNSGLMVAQYTAAALASANKMLSHPASVDSIGVSADQENHVSMGPIAARKCTEMLEKNVRAVLAVEMTSAAQARVARSPTTSSVRRSPSWLTIASSTPTSRRSAV